MQLDEVGVFGPRIRLARVQALQQHSNATEENSKNQGDQEKDSDQREDGDDEIADVVAFADGCCLVPRDLSFVVHRIQQVLRVATANRTSDNGNQRTAASREERGGAG